MSKLPLFKPHTYIIPKEKPECSHPWERSIKDKYFHRIKHSHNSIHNPPFPSSDKNAETKRIKFTVIGNRCKKEFIYCVRLLQGICKYRSKEFDPPTIRGVTSLEWQIVWQSLKQTYGEAYCLLSEVAVFIDDQVLGGENELKELIEAKYIYYLCLDYHKEAISEFARFVNLCGKPCAYMQIMIDEEDIGTMTFMLYSNILPRTCDNFLRLCNSTRGGYGGSPIHRIVKDGWIQGGGFRLKSSNLNCENFAVPHDRRGVLCMTNDGRDIDCSTQFFVLLQPAPWMANKYVAFGQLIDGDNVLKRIESEPCFYEAPINNITIYKAGILNLDCHDFVINKPIHKYIDNHIDDLVTLGIFFYELLLEHVFLEIECKLVADGLSALGEKDIEIQEGSDKENESSKFNSKASGQSEGDNQDFDVEDYVPEGFSSTAHGISLQGSDGLVKPKKPFYLPLTDVRYPGEIDSTYDLKKFLRGDYCHESDLAKVIMRTKIVLQSNAETLSDEFHISDSDFNISDDSDQSVVDYLKNNTERLSFAGGIVKNIGRGNGMMDLFENSRKSELPTFTDEELRQFRKMSVSVPDHERRISHRQSVLQNQFKQNAAKRQSFAVAKREKKPEDEEDEDDDDEVYVQVDTRKISMQVPKIDKHDMPGQIKRRQTGFVNQEDLEKIRVFQRKSISSSEDDSDDEDQDGADQGHAGKVRMAPSTLVDTKSKMKRRPTAFVRPAEIPDDDGDDNRTQMEKYLKKKAADEANKGPEPDAPGPTFKSYQPLKKNIFGRAKESEKEIDLAEKSEYLRPSLTLDDDDKLEKAMKSHSKKKPDKLSAGTDKQMAKSYEYGKARPSISVAEYQKRNHMLQAAVAKPKIKVQVDTAPSAKKGLRLPGDSPLWSSDSTLSDVVTIFSTRKDPEPHQDLIKQPKEPDVVKLDI